MKEKLKNPLVQQYFLEIALPVVGYFFFDWSVTIIAAFFLIDFFCAEIARNRRVFKVYRSTKNANQTFFIISMMTGGFLFALSLAWTWWNFEMRFENTLDHFYLELTDFAREEMWFLLPLVYFVYHVKDVMTFYMPRRFLKRDYKKMVKFQILELLVMTSLILIGVSCWRYFEMDDLTAIFSFIIFKIAFDILIARFFDAKYRME